MTHWMICVTYSKGEQWIHVVVEKLLKNIFMLIGRLYKNKPTNINRCQTNQSNAVMGSSGAYRFKQKNVPWSTKIYPIKMKKNNKRRRHFVLIIKLYPSKQKLVPFNIFFTWCKWIVFAKLFLFFEERF